MAIDGGQTAEQILSLVFGWMAEKFDDLR